MKCKICQGPLCEIDMCENPNFCFRCWLLHDPDELIHHILSVGEKPYCSVNDTIWEEMSLIDNLVFRLRYWLHTHEFKTRS